MDTSVLIQVERGLRLLDAVAGPSDDLAIATITAAELLLGVELSDAPHHRARRDRTEGLLRRFSLIDYDLQIARVHASFMALTRRSGRQRGAHDLIIGATAAATSRPIVTLDPRGFEDLPGVTMRSEP